MLAHVIILTRFMAGHVTYHFSSRHRIKWPIIIYVDFTLCTNELDARTRYYLINMKRDNT